MSRARRLGRIGTAPRACFPAASRIAPTMRSPESRQLVWRKRWHSTAGAGQGSARPTLIFIP
jgi:hypothetical protein